MISLPARFTPLNGKSGGMSSVIKCTDTRLNRPVMIKYLDPSTDQQRLLDEIQALQSIRSDYVVQIYDVVTDDTNSIVGVVEEFCEGVDLSDFIGKIDGQQFLKYGYQLVSGIVEVHSHNIIHRDIKPHNVRVGSLDRLTLIDFGLARSVGGANTVSAIGTSGFMAPELFYPDPAGKISFTKAIDVFAFSSSMYLLGAGTLPSDLCKRPPLLPSGTPSYQNLPFKIDSELATLLEQAFIADIAKRPTASDLQAVFLKLLLRGRHRALLNIANNPQYLDANKRRATAAFGGLASLTIEYDNDRFVAVAVSGEVYVNAAKVQTGYTFPGSCVIAFGGPDLGARRQYITFDVSHPGVVL